MRFELTVLKNTPDFKSGALNHSATSPFVTRSGLEPLLSGHEPNKLPVT